MFRLNKKSIGNKPLNFKQIKRSDPFIEQSTEDTVDIDPTNMYSDSYIQRRKEFDKYNDKFYEKAKISSDMQSKPQKVLRTNFKDYKPENKSVGKINAEIETAHVTPMYNRLPNISMDKIYKVSKD